MKSEIFINMQNEILTGNILDVGMDNYGIVYNLYKHYNNEAAVDYVHGKEEKRFIEKSVYDSCIMLFSLRNIWLKINKRNCLKEISNFLREDGVLHIWDIDKKYFKIFKGKIKVLLPENNIKEIIINDLNFANDTSKESIVKLIKEYFEIIDLKSSDNIYYIKARKKRDSIVKGSNRNESNVSSSEFKIHS
jgi:ubiquinone/menaquinone biosynthesis C-methylase UbiE